MNKKIKYFIGDKRGSHVGVILSFVIFITCVIFLYIIINPAVKTSEDKTSILEYVENQILENVSANFTSTSIQISSSANPTTKCIKLQDLLILTEMGSSRIRVKNESYGIQQAYFGTGEDFGALIINRNNSDNLFFRIYYSPEFGKLEESSMSSCTEINYENYSIGVIQNGVYAFEEKLYTLIEDYQNHYEQLKTDLKIPSAYEFGLSFTKSDGTAISVGNAGDTAVYAEEIPFQYIDEDANVQSGFINIKIW